MLTDWRQLSCPQKKVIIRIVLAIVSVYFVITYFGVTAMLKSKTLSDLTHISRMDSVPTKSAEIPLNTLSEAYTNVTVGTYIDSIESFSIKDSAWNTTFYIWFNWKGDRNINPGNEFQIINGTIFKKELQEDFHDDNGVNYEQYLVTAKITQFFDTSRIPIEDHMLNLHIEDGARDITQIRYIADNDSNISSRVTIPGYKITSNRNVIKNHNYKSSFGDPRVSSANKNIYSQYISSIQISRLDFGFYFKIFLSLFAALLLTFISFFIKASEIAPRFALPTGAYFGAVANTYVTNSLLPSSGAFGLIDIINGIGLFTIFSSIALSIFSYYLVIHKHEKLLSNLFDKIIVLVLGICCILANIAIPLVARG